MLLLPVFLVKSLGLGVGPESIQFQAQVLEYYSAEILLTHQVPPLYLWFWSSPSVALLLQLHLDLAGFVFLCPFAYPCEGVVTRPLEL